MFPRTIFFYGWLGCLLCGGPAAPAAAPADPAAVRPNIIFLLADQWRSQAFGYAGDANVQTPHLDRLERESVNFTGAVAGTPVCSPTRATLLTGRRPLSHGVFLNDVPLDPGAVTLAKVLGAAGYATACIGKWHVDGHGSRSAFIPRERRQGFEYWKVLECTHDYLHSKYFADTPEPRYWEGYDARAQTRDAQAWLRGRALAGTNAPFLLWLAFGPPHNPYETAPPEYRARYRPEAIQLRGNVPAGRSEKARRELAGYYAHCTALDDCIGELWETLAATGLATNTILVFTSDHGDMLWSQDQPRKQRPFAESARVPLLFHLPASLGIAPVRSGAMINTEDVLPTLLALAGLPVPAGVEGRDFTGAMRGGPDPSGGATVVRCIVPFGEYSRKAGGREYRALVTPRYTYARDLRGPWLLYDHQADPEELRNLAAEPAFAPLRDELDQRLRATLAAQGDEFLPGPEYVRRWGYAVGPDETMPYQP